MTTTLEIQLIDQDFREAIARLQVAAADLSPLMAQIAAHLEAVAQRAFENESDPNTGGKWAALSPRYLARRQRMGRWPGKILQLTGEMAASLVSESDADSALVAIGTSYAKYHQFGTSRMPARPFLGLDEQGEQDIRQATLDYLRAAIEDNEAG